MSNLQFAFISKNRVPTRESLQKAIDDLGFDFQLTLDPNLNLLTDEGFCPCVLNQNEQDDVGFELYSGDPKDVYEDSSNLDEIAGNLGFCLMFRYSSNLGDLACILVTCCALQKQFGAIISYEGEKPHPYEVLEKETKEVLVEYCASA